MHRYVVRHSMIVVLLIVLVFAFSVMLKRNRIVRQEGSCLYVRSALLKMQNKPADLYIPQCTLYGYYFRQQCNPGHDQCWCVTPMGKRIVGTEVSGYEQPKQCHLNWFAEFFRRMQE